MQGPSALDGAVSTRSDTLPLGVTTDHIISFARLHPWQLNQWPNCSGPGPLSQQVPAPREQPGCTTDLCWDYKFKGISFIFTSTLTTRWHSWIMKGKKLHTPFPMDVFFLPSFCFTSCGFYCMWSVCVSMWHYLKRLSATWLSVSFFILCVKSL